MPAPAGATPSPDAPSPGTSAGDPEPSADAVPPAGRLRVVARHPEHRGHVEASDAPEHACALVGARRVLFDRAAAPTAVGLEEGHAVAAYVPSPEGLELFVLVVPEGRRPVRRLAHFAVTPPVRPAQLVPPGLMRIGTNKLGVATVDAQRRLVYREIDRETGEPSEPLVLAEGSADTRFPPALAMAGELRLVAYTRFGNPMRVELVVLDDTPRAIRRHDLTPDSAGAASPGFVRGSEPPLLVLVDPREAFSLSHAIAFDTEGQPGDEDPLQPIVGLESPPRLVAALGPHDLEIAFLAHGGTNHMGSFLLASRASSITPRALVPASDHARLWVDAIGTGYGVVTSSLGPRGGVSLADREVVVRLVDVAGIGPELRIAPTRGSAIYPTLSRDDAGRLVVVYGTDATIELQTIACHGTAR